MRRVTNYPITPTSEKYPTKLYKSESIGAIIRNAYENGVPPSMTAVLGDDEENGDAIDPNCDLRSDFFDIADDLTDKAAMQAGLERAKANTSNDDVGNSDKPDTSGDGA